MGRRRSNGHQNLRRVNGILLLDKPAGLTSNAALQAVKKMYAARKAGHTGSLDPLATGLLPLCFGEATKVSGFLLDADKDYHVSADLTGQANHLGVTLQADIIKQKQPENNGGYTAMKYGKTSPLVYDQLTSDHPIDLCRWQVANCYMGRVGLINSGGASGRNDFGDAVHTAVINKRAGGTGLISGRKAFQRPMKEGVQLLNLIQDVYLARAITPA